MARLHFTDADLEGFLDEAAPAETMAAIERALRDDSQLARRLTRIRGRRDAGVHSLGDVWRRERISCPTREELGSFLLGVLEDGHADYLRFHIHRIGCRICRANLADLQAEQEEAAPAATQRRTRYFQSSAGYLDRSE